MRGRTDGILSQHRRTDEYKLVALNVLLTFFPVLPGVPETRIPQESTRAWGRRARALNRQNVKFTRARSYSPTASTNDWRTSLVARLGARQRAFVEPRCDS